MNDNRFGNFIRELRRERGLSQEELGAALFVHRTSINKWEKGNVIPLNDTLLRISDYFDVSVDELLNGKRNLHEENKSEGTNMAIRDLIKSKKKLNIVLFFSVVFIFILVTFFLSYYFVTTFDSNHVYLVNGSNDNFMMRDGLLIVSNDKVYFRVGIFYLNRKKISINESSKIRIIYGEDERVLLKGDATNLLVEVAKSKEFLIKILEDKEPFYLEFVYEEELQKLELDYYEDFSNDSFLLDDDNSLCSSNNDENTCDSSNYSSRIKSNNDNIVDVLIKNGYKYDVHKKQYYLESKNFSYYYDKDKFCVISNGINGKFVLYNIYFLDKTLRVLDKKENKEIFIYDYCKIDKNDVNYDLYKEFYNKILPHYFRDFLGCE